jgi:hypothetical protein
VNNDPATPGSVYHCSIQPVCKPAPHQIDDLSMTRRQSTHSGIQASCPPEGRTGCFTSSLEEEAALKAHQGALGPPVRPVSARRRFAGSYGPELSALKACKSREGFLLHFIFGLCEPVCEDAAYLKNSVCVPILVWMEGKDSTGCL